MDFPLDVPIPDDTLIAGAILLVRGVDPDGQHAWFIRTSGEPGSQWERIGFLGCYLDHLQDEAVSCWEPQ